MVPAMDVAVEMVQKADILVIIGTSMQVYPAAGLIRYAGRQVPVFLIDPGEVSVGFRSVNHIKKGASEGVKILKELLESLR
jgi:NAD-dependent deacetylase